MWWTLVLLWNEQATKSTTTSAMAHVSSNFSHWCSQEHCIRQNRIHSAFILLTERHHLCKPRSSAVAMGNSNKFEKFLSVFGWTVELAEVWPRPNTPSRSWVRMFINLKIVPREPWHAVLCLLCVLALVSMCITCVWFHVPSVSFDG